MTDLIKTLEFLGLFVNCLMRMLVRQKRAARDSNGSNPCATALMIAALTWLDTQEGNATILFQEEGFLEGS